MTHKEKRPPKHPSRRLYAGDERFSLRTQIRPESEVRDAYLKLGKAAAVRVSQLSRQANRQQTDGSGARAPLNIGDPRPFQQAAIDEARQAVWQAAGELLEVNPNAHKYDEVG